jgi:hypothetical protein
MAAVVGGRLDAGLIDGRARERALQRRAGDDTGQIAGAGDGGEAGAGKHEEADGAQAGAPRKRSE